MDSLIATAALFETLFNKRTIGQRDEATTTSVLIDSFQDEFLFDQDLDLNSLKANNEYLQRKLKNIDEVSEQQRNALFGRSNNIICSFDFLHLIGWKYHKD